LASNQYTKPRRLLTLSCHWHTGSGELLEGDQESGYLCGTRQNTRGPFLQVWWLLLAAVVVVVVAAAAAAAAVVVVVVVVVVVAVVRIVVIVVIC